MKICFMDNNGWISVDNFKINGSELNFKNKNIEEVWYNNKFLIIRIERITKSEYKIMFFKKDVKGNKIKAVYENELEIEIKCVKCGRIMKHLITKYPLSDFLINCYTERFYNCLKVEGGCGYEVIIGVDEC